ncbi:anti-silencing protein ASF 1 like protein [Perkinsela sp. CCAP 1560/4]|nr:anti-silencing protein ASF 1 like protein [Perkinsela sp. CCAP 1560/4]|eukprot:KNH04046.1 anti-silencing protein ASF 1 like protein [Perkinsela sp. CCAP 1560/4]
MHRCSCWPPRSTYALLQLARPISRKERAEFCSNEIAPSRKSGSQLDTLSNFSIGDQGARCRLGELSSYLPSFPSNKVTQGGKCNFTDFASIVDLDKLANSALCAQAACYTFVNIIVHRRMNFSAVLATVAERQAHLTNLRGGD